VFEEPAVSALFISVSFLKRHYYNRYYNSIFLVMGIGWATHLSLVEGSLVTCQTEFRGD
jgi:hypothetical protein